MNVSSFEFEKAGQMSYSVVIATLGGPTLVRTINQLNLLVPPPNEILVCIPQTEFSNLPSLVAPKVKIHVTSARGQVAQRAEGFAKAVGPLVLQMDDDMLPSIDCVEKLMQSFAVLGPMAAIAPLLTNIDSGMSVYRKPAAHEWVNRVYYWLLNGNRGYQPGAVLKAGTPVGIVEQLANGKVLEVEWLAGGCVLHHKDNLVLQNFFPYRGKAYSEDLMHSHYLRQKGIRLYVATAARCALELEAQERIECRRFLRMVCNDWRARSFYARMSGRGGVRMWFFYVLWIVSYLGTQLRRGGFGGEG